MSSYQENLHSSVVSSLNTQELELQNVEGKLEASMFSLYYAQGARITTAEELEITTSKYAFEKLVHEQAIIDSDLSTNVLTSANNAKDYTAKSVTNTSVAAANVQIAANAILKLASDAGSIFSIINAADFDTDIYAQSNKANVLMNDTAYAAEQASQHSMVASSSIAEVTTTNLADKATVTDTYIKDLLSVVTKQFDDTTTLLFTQSAELATANTAEKQAEGVLEDYSVGFEATEAAYRLSNDELNLNLTAKTPVIVGDHDSYMVSFSPYESAFQEQTVGTSETHSVPKDTNQPVESYNIMLVENSNNGTFSMNDAEGIFSGGFPDRFISMSDEDITTITVKDEKTGKSKIIKKIAKKIYTSGTNTPILKDSQGKDLVLGQEYVIFVFAVFKTAYKKIINTFDDYLSAPSKMFVIENQLNSVDTNIIPEVTAEISEEDAKSNTPNYQVLNFDIFENPDYQVAYRCVFLPNNPDLVKGLLTVEGVGGIKKDILQLTKIEEVYEDQVADINAQIKLITTDIQDLNTTIEANLEKITKAKSGSSEEKSSIDKNVTLNETLKKKEGTLSNLKTELENLNMMKVDDLANVNIDKHIQPGFFFNLTTAEKISARSYTVAAKTDSTLKNYLVNSTEDVYKYAANIAAANVEENSRESTGSEEATKESPTAEIAALKTEANKAIDDGKPGILLQTVRKTKTYIQSISKSKSKIADINLFFDNYNRLVINLLLLTKKSYVHKQMEITIKAETTDNFGNRLISNNKYIPAVISITDNSNETVNTQFINALSDFNRTASFTYKDPNASSTEIVSYPKQTTLNQS
jgi:hypothetical protein